MNKLSRNSRLLPAFVAVVVMCAAHPGSAVADDVVRIGGAGAGLGVAKILAAAFEKSHPGTTIKVLPSLGSSGGVKALVHGALDVAISGRALKSEEVKDGAVAVECARTPFIFAVNRNVSKSDLTSTELEQIYKGQLLKWPDGKRIRLILRPAAETDTKIVQNISKSMEQAVIVSNTRPDMIIAVTDQETVDSVAKIPGALGGTTLAQLETEKPPLKVLSFNGIKPSLDALAMGRYPLVKPLYLVSTPRSSATALQFIQFAQSPKGRAILTASGSLPPDSSKRVK
jgi:phosphate transport system substrate-binding protein